MNKIYKVVWSKAKNCYIVASELAKSVTKSGRSVLSLSLAHNCRKLSLATALGISFLAGPTIGWALPEQSGAMTSGVQITAPAKEMSIKGTADNNVINWRSFNIANDEKVGFDAKNYLNLINDSKSSRIDGTLSGAGNIYLVNPNGVIFGSDSSVNVGNLSVSTRPLSKVDRDAFLRGQDPLANAASNVGGDIVNLTDIKATKVLLEGNTITLTNNISNTNLNVRALTGVNVGFTDGDKPVTEINITQFTKPLDDSSISNFKNSHNKFSLKALDGKTDLSSDKFTPYYSVRNIYELQNMQNNPDEQYLLGRDIDAGDTKDWNDGAGFAPIFGNHATNYAFTGVFDGNGFKIKNMYINCPDGEGVGLFGFTQNATLKNVVLEGGSVTGYSNVGALIGSAMGGTIVEGTVNDVSVTGVGGQAIGGLVGSAEASKVVGSIHNATVAGTNEVDDIGGLVGAATDNSVIIGFTGEDTAISAAEPQNGGVGGLVGNADNATVKGYNQGTVSLTADGSGGNFGGLVGHMGGTATVSGFNLGKVGSADATNAGGIVGMVDATENSTILGYNLGELGGTVKGKLVGTVADGTEATVKGNSTNSNEAIGAGAVNTFESWDNVEASAFKTLDGKVFGADRLDWTRPDPSDWSKVLLDIEKMPNNNTTWYIKEEESYPLLNKYFTSSDEYILDEVVLPTDYTYNAKVQQFNKSSCQSALSEALEGKPIKPQSTGAFKLDPTASFASEFKDAGDYKFTTTWIAPYKFNTNPFITATIKPRKLQLQLDETKLPKMKGFSKNYDGTTSSKLYLSILYADSSVRIDADMSSEMQRELNEEDDTRTKVVNLKVPGEFNSKNVKEADSVTFKNGMTLGGSRGRNYILDTTGLSGNPTNGICIENENNDIVVKNCKIEPMELTLTKTNDASDYFTKEYDGTADVIGDIDLSNIFMVAPSSGSLSDELKEEIKNSNFGVKIIGLRDGKYVKSDGSDYAEAGTSKRVIFDFDRIEVSGETENYKLSVSENSGTTTYGNLLYVSDGKIRIDSVGVINPKTIKLTPNDSKVYDGKDYSGNDSSKIAITDENGNQIKLCGNDKLTVETSSTGVNASGDSDGYELKINNYTIDDGNGGKNYTVSVSDGKLVITPKKINITVTDNKEYDGKAYTDNGSAKVILTDENGNQIKLCGNDKLSIEKTSSTGINVSGDSDGYELKINNYIIDDGNDGKNYTVSVSDGKLVITPKKINITVTDNKEYDGKAYTDNGSAKVILTDENGNIITLCGNDKLSIEKTSSTGINVSGDSDGYELKVNSYTIDDGNGGKNYTVCMSDGKLYIKPRTIELSFKGTPITKVYDGTTDTEQTLSDLFGLYGTDGLLSEEYERLLKVYGKFADAEPGKNKVVDFGTTVGSNYTLVFKDLNGNILQPSSIVGEITGKPIPPEPIPPEPEIKSDITIGTLLRNDSASMVFEALNVNAAMTRPSEDNRDDGVIGAAPNGAGLTAENQARLADSYNKVSDDDSSADEKKKKKTGSKKSS